MNDIFVNIALGGLLGISIVVVHNLGQIRRLLQEIRDDLNQQKRIP